MSLSERIKAAQNASADARVGGDADATAQIREHLHLILPPETIAKMMAESPKRAENEVRRACRTVLDNAPWLLEQAEARDSLIEGVVDGIFGMGPIESMLADDEITEIMVNGSRSVYVERRGCLERTAAVFQNDEQVRALIDRIIGPLGRRIDESSPMVNARLPQGHRVNAVIAPLSLEGPVLTIRKFTANVMTLEEMVESGSFDARMTSFLTWAVRARKNIAVSGGTGSGKTTLLNALSCKIDQRERILTIEDSAELRFLEHNHVIRLEARPRNAEGSGEVTIRDLVTNALRMRPDRIIVGECRSGEALDMLQAMNTGHDGSMTTLHANSPADAVMRLTTMVRYVADLPVDVIQTQIASALDCIVQTARAADGGRYVREVASVAYDWQNRRCCLNPLFTWDERRNIGRWVAVPDWIDELQYKGLAKDEEVEKWMCATSLSA